MRLPDCPFYLFGMGHRRKLLYRAGTLSDALTGESLRQWDVASEAIHPSEYSVNLETSGGRAASITEDEVGVWVEEDGRRTRLTDGPLRLPRFEGYEHAPLLRSLHHEIVINVVNGKPVPNLFVYGKPWRRDAAMVCMCLQETGNLHLVEEWIKGLTKPFDRNNQGNCEPDNLGQTLYMISLVSNASHPLVQTILDAARRCRKGNHITGPTDFAEHPVFQTKWLKFGLRSLGLDDAYQVPEVYDSYSALFWMDYRDAHVEGDPFDERSKELYPYLGWAEAHFHGWPANLAFARDQYPATWEAQASQADYSQMAHICSEYVDRRICAPHSWHAAEMFLYLLERPPSG